jgi:hypothetical protein
MKVSRYRFVSVSLAIFMALQSYFSASADNQAQTSITVYVSTTGSGTACSQITPCSLTTGLGKLSAGSTLLLASGNYATTLRITKSGTASQPIKVSGAAIFNAVNISGSYVEVAGLEVAGAPSHGVLLLGKHIKFTNFSVHDNVNENKSGAACSGTGSWGSGLKVERGSEDIFIANGTIFHNCGEGFAATMGMNVTVSNVTSYDNFSANFYIDNSKQVTLQNSFTYCTTNANYYRSGQPATGILIGEEYYSGWGGQLANLTIINNISYGCKGLNFYGVESGVTNPGLAGALIAHNTIWNIYAGGRAISISTQLYNQGIVIGNNIVGGTISSANATLKNNQNTAVFATSPTNNPLSFKTASNSPGINAGALLGVNSDFGNSARVSAPDVGAWEFTGNAVTATVSKTPTKTATVPGNTLTLTKTPTRTNVPVTPTKTATPVNVTTTFTKTATPTTVSVTSTPLASPTNPPAGQNSLDVRIAAGNDDVEEDANRWVYLDSSDLELVYDSSTQKIGLRFTGINIPQNATITNAYIRFKVDETSSETVNLKIQGEATANALAFGGTTGNVSSRPVTSNFINWTPAPWTTVAASGADQTTPNLAPVIQEIISQPGWASGNALVILFSGTTGKRVAEAYEDDSMGAALLHIEYNVGNTAWLRIVRTPTATVIVESPTAIVPTLTNTAVVTPTVTLSLPTLTTQPTETLILLPTETPTSPPPSEP